MAKKSKTTALATVPQDDAQLGMMVADLGAAVARIHELTAVADQQKAEIDRQLACDTANDNEIVKSYQAGIAAYVEANRARLTPRGKKTITLKSGTIEYRAGQLSIAVRGVDSVIAGLEKSGNGQFVTVKKAVNKQALLDYVRMHGIEALPNVAGLSVKQGAETLDIKPNAIQEDVGNG